METVPRSCGFLPLVVVERALAESAWCPKSPRTKNHTIKCERITQRMFQKIFRESARVVTFKIRSSNFWGKGIGHKNITVPDPLIDGEVHEMNNSFAILWWNGGATPKRINTKNNLGGYNAFALHSSFALNDCSLTHAGEPTGKSFPRMTELSL